MTENNVEGSNASMGDSLEDTAYHEAGHFVAATLIALMPGTISIEPDGDSLGRVTRLGEYALSAKLLIAGAMTGNDRYITLDNRSWNYVKVLADTDAFLTASGAIAAQIYSGNEDSHSWGDLFHACDLYEAVYVDDGFDRYEKIKEYTLHIFRDKTVWSAVEHVAQVLLKYKALDEEASADLYIQTIDMLEGKIAGPHFRNLQQLYPKSDLESAQP